MHNILKRPYPSTEANFKSLLMSIGFGLFVGFFLVYFKPFGLDSISLENKNVKILGFGLVTFLVMMVFHFLIPKYFPSITNEKRWTVGKEIIYLILLIVLISIGNFIYSGFIGSTQLDPESFVFMTRNTIIVGLFPIVLMIMVDHNRKLRKNVEEAASINLEANPVITEERQLLHIKTDAVNEKLSLHPDDFIYAEAEGNYVNVYFLDPNSKQLTKSMVRSSMKNIEEHLNSSNIKRCHRSYMVNLKKVESINGNAQGYRLLLKHTDDLVHVSRKYIPLIKEYYDN